MEKEAAWLRSEDRGEDEVRRETAYKSGIPFVILSRDDISPESLALIPEPLSRARNIVAYRHGPSNDLGVNEVEVALLDINDLHSIDFLLNENSGVRFKVKPRLTSRDSIKRALLMYQKQLKEKFAGLVEKGVEAADSLLRHALHSNATHIHLEPAAAAVLVRYRINGVLHEAMRLPEYANEFIQQRIKSLAKMFPITTTTQEGRFKIEHNGEHVTVRVSTVPIVPANSASPDARPEGSGGEKMLLRLARESHGQKGFTLSSLGFHGEGLERVHELLNKRTGLVVVSGGAESGTTTTLYTLLDELNHPGVSISTIEEKVDYILPHVAQTQTRSDVGLDLLAGLRAILRTDPDVVMVSDIRQSEVAELAALSAKRGIFVLAGMSAKSPAKVREILESHAASVIINQRLVRKLCQECKETYRPSREELEPLESGGNPDASVGVNFGRVLAALKEEEIIDKDTPWKELDFYRSKNNGESCSTCDGGYKGRIGIQAITFADESSPDASEAFRELNLIEDGIFKAAQGLTSIEEVLSLI